uniref:Mitochondrial carrier protein n=1 Tax=Chromera velia CCMP2878 TaxID=1169474 RepID=A0A0G4HLB8_9ALVE|eukprot:Cvel_28948.t1-p1 / transcript=Cvel_28948.t1 / gene=Cvel_28948 / organism=Chromera_velia_CCMP2878 / gene_product=hypothetical protein / transcript_product=hypothetical protein / location=Cvel_scaffold3882:5273-8847(+) / protein_length=501 / sequence_SO=supercontig / SO=protein_coding / is_pseudo=false
MSSALPEGGISGPPNGPSSGCQQSANEIGSGSESGNGNPILKDYVEAATVGALRGLARLPLEHPFDRVRTLWQRHPHLTSVWQVSALMRKGGGQALNNLKEKGQKQKMAFGGLWGLYAGAVPNAARLALKEVYRWPMMLALPPLYTGLFFSHKAGADKDHAGAKTLAGFTVASVEAFILCPIERMKVVLMTHQSGSAKHAMRELFRSVLHPHPPQPPTRRHPEACNPASSGPSKFPGTASSSPAPSTAVEQAAALGGRQNGGAACSVDGKFGGDRIAGTSLKSPRGTLGGNFFGSLGALHSILYRGVGVLYMRQVVAWTTFLAADAKLKALAKKMEGKEKLGPVTMLAVGAGVGVLNTLCVMPFDCVKTQMQSIDGDGDGRGGGQKSGTTTGANGKCSSAPSSATKVASFSALDDGGTHARPPPENHRGKGITATALSIYRDHGVRGFYVGFRLRIIQYLMNAIVTVYLLDFMERRWARFYLSVPGKGAACTKCPSDHCDK